MSTATAEKTHVSDVQESCTNEDETAGIHFFPPLYTQRYSLAIKYLMHYEVKSVIDFGCSDCGFFSLLSTVPTLEHIALVDVDHDLLVRKQRVIVPQLYHFLHRRSVPLHISLYAGNAKDTDARILCYEAVTLIEVIEHLNPDVLEQVTINVFQNLQPKVCIVTTPNSEFNVLFENDDPNQFRHWDHKFEWTRKEFKQWCSNVCEMYGYNVEYTGVGTLASRPESHHLGPCSQAAVFTIQNSEKRSSENQCDNLAKPYELIAESDFPYHKDELTLEDKIDQEVSYCLRLLFLSTKDSVEFGEDVYIDVSKIAAFPSVKRLCSEDGVRESLQRRGNELSANGHHVIVKENEASENDPYEDYDGSDLGHHGEEDVGDFSKSAQGLENNDSHGQSDIGVNEELFESDSSIQNQVQHSVKVDEEDWDLDCG